MNYDSGIIKNASIEKVSKLKPAFSKTGTTTAGNSSQMTDGAAVVFLASEEYAKQNNLPMLGIFHGFRAAGVSPDIMGVGPTAAIPKLLTAHGLKVDDIDVFELNEAFASQCTFCRDSLNIPKEKINP